MSIGERIKLLRKEAGLNQTDFGGRVGLKQTSIAMYEKGERQVSNQSITLIANAFHVREEWLRTGEEPKDAPRISALLEDVELDETDRTIIASYLSLSPDKRQILKEFIKETAAQLVAAPARAEKEKELAAVEQRAAELRAELGEMPAADERDEDGLTKEEREEMDTKLNELRRQMILEKTSKTSAPSRFIGLG